MSTRTSSSSLPVAEVPATDMSATEVPATEVPATEMSATEVPVDPQVARLTRWSWLSVGLFFVVLVPGAALGAAGGVGWLAATGLLALQMTPVVVGTVLGARATKRGGGALAGSAFAVNVLLVVYALMLQVVELSAG